jgi:Na+-translocating ferredoxin:NAD+ oxidoreductase RNF subunit RnfB
VFSFDRIFEWSRFMTPALVSALLMMGGLGVIIGIALAVASKVFYVYVDPKILAIDDALPGAN